MFLKNPIFKREFTSTSRSLKTNFLIIAYILLLAAVMLLLWPRGGVQSVVSESGKQIFSLFFSINLTLLILLIPAFTATSITYEKENETFSSLFTTLLSPFDIMIGKLAASILMLIVISLLSMPIAAVCALTGGINLAFMTKIMILIITTSITYGLIGLACSAVSKRSSSSIILNYVFILLLAGATWLPAALLSNLLPDQAMVWQAMRSISPYDAIFYLLYPDNYKMSMNIQLEGGMEKYFTPFNIYLAASALISFIALIVFYGRILRPNTKTSGAKGEIFTDTKKTIKRKLTWPFYIFDPLKRKKSIKRFANPVFVAEMRSKLFANPKFVLRGVCGIFILSMGLLTLIAFQFGVGLKADLVRMVAIIFQIGVVGMLAPGVSSGLITDEKTSGTFTALRMTPLKPTTVVMGKLKATFFYALIFIISSIFVLLAMAYLEHQDVWPEMEIKGESFFTEQVPEFFQKLPAWGSELFGKAKEAKWWDSFWETYKSIIAWIFILLLTTVTFLTGGLFSSSYSKTTGISTAISYALAATICIVSFAPVALGARLSESVSAVVLSFNPIAAAMQITSDAFPQYPNLWIHNLIALAGLSLFFLLASVARAWYLFRKQE